MIAPSSSLSPHQQQIQYTTSSSSSNSKQDLHTLPPPSSEVSPASTTSPATATSAGAQAGEGAAPPTTHISVSLEAIKAALLSKTPHPLQSLEGYRRASIAAPEFHQAVTAPGLSSLPFNFGGGFQQQQQQVGGIGSEVNGAGNNAGGVNWQVQNPFGGDPAAAAGGPTPVASTGHNNNNNNNNNTNLTSLFSEIPSTFSGNNHLLNSASGTVSALVDPIDYSQLSKELFSFSPAQDLRPLPAAAALAAAAGTGAGIQQDVRRPSIATAASELTLSDFSPLTPADALEQPSHQQQHSLKDSSGSNLSLSAQIRPSTGGTATTAELDLEGSPLTPLSAALSFFGGEVVAGDSSSPAGASSRSAGFGESAGVSIGPSPFANTDWSFDGGKVEQQQPEAGKDTEMSPMVSSKANGMGAAGSPHAAAAGDVGASPGGRKQHLSGYSNGGAPPPPANADAVRASSTNGFFSDPFASNAASTAAAVAPGRAHELSHDGSALGSSFSGAAGEDERVGSAGAGAGPYSAHSAGTSATAASFSGPSTAYGSSSAHHQYMPAHILHRASISGPIMQHHHGYSVPTGHGAVGGQHAGATGLGGAQPPAAAPTMSAAPPLAGDMAAWAHAHGSARPHTADGFYGPFGFNTGGFPHAASTAGSLTPTNTAGDDGGFSRNDGSHSHFVSSTLVRSSLQRLF